MKKILFSLLMFVGLIMSLHALDTGQTGIDIQKSQSVIVTDPTQASTDGAECNKVNIWHKDTLMHVSDNGLDTGINFNMALCNTATQLATCNTEGGLAVETGGV